MKPWIVYDAATGHYLGRILAREGEQFDEAVGCWPKVKTFRIDAAPTAKDVAKQLSESLHMPLAPHRGNIKTKKGSK